MALSFSEAVIHLNDRSSPKRRAGAKRLRGLSDDTAGPALLEALKTEVNDSRTWETQYQMVMALGTMAYLPALDFLNELAAQQDDDTMLGVGLGDAIVRIEWAHNHTLRVVDQLIDSAPLGVVDGAFRAIAMLRLVPPESLLERIIAFGSARQPTDGIRFWIAAAAAGWHGATVRTYLEQCAESSNSTLAAIATTSLSGVYEKLDPL